MKPEFARLLQLDGFIMFIEGNKGDGKTNFSMYLTEVCYHLNFREHFASNIPTDCEYIRMIDNYPALKNWLENEKGKKLYVLDEAGKHVKRMRFMTEQNVQIMDLLQLIRHYDTGFIGIAPSAKYVDSNFLNTDLLDARIRKESKTFATINDFHSHKTYPFKNIPKTSIVHDDKHISTFTMQGELGELTDIQNHALDYARTGNAKLTGKKYGINQEQVLRDVRTVIKTILRE